MAKLTYASPARNFNEALPIGNGRIGAMVYGGLGSERISLNHDSLWAGLHPPPPRPAASTLAPIRAALFAGDRAEAERLVETEHLTTFTQPYLPAGTLVIDWPEGIAGVIHNRTLDLSTALATARADWAEGSIRREYFASALDNVIAIRLDMPQATGPIRISLASLLTHQIAASDDTLCLTGRVPSAVFWEDVESPTTESHQVHYDDASSRHYAIRLWLGTRTGQITADGPNLILQDATDAVILIAIETDAGSADPAAACAETLAAARRKGIAKLMADHIQDHASLFDRFSLALGDNPTETFCSTDQCLASFAGTQNDPGLFVLMSDYSRYLMIASSRAGTMPANLQGIWNEDVMPPWWSNYTININTQMNYWAAEAHGLGDCHTALLDFVSDLAKLGAATARVQYGLPGWVTHHQTDFRRQTTPVGFSRPNAMRNPSKWAFWPFGGAWLSLHLHEHYLYSGDLAFLRDRAHSVLKGAAEFLISWLIDDPREPGLLTTAPSTSPENTYVDATGQTRAITIGSTMDISITRAVLQAFIAADRDLGGPETALSQRALATLARLPELDLSSDGRIIEFDADWPEAEAPHRHISQLFALAPGTEICPRDTPDLAEAARKTLDARGDSGTGWSLAWKALCWARLGHGERAYALLCGLLRMTRSDIRRMANLGGGVYPNLLTACPPFQIDANFGFAAALNAMIVQDHRADVVLLPALPAALSSGRIKRIRLRGSLTLSMQWRDGQLLAASVSSTRHQTRRFRLAAHCIEVDLSPGQDVDLKMLLSQARLSQEQECVSAP